MSGIAEQPLTARQYDAYREYFHEATRPLFTKLAFLELQQPMSFIVQPNGMLGQKTVRWSPEALAHADKIRECIKLCAELAKANARSEFP